MSSLSRNFSKLGKNLLVFGILAVTAVLQLGTKVEANPLSNYTEIAENTLGDKIFLINSSLRTRKLGRINQRYFTTVSILASPKSNGATRINTSYMADCNAPVIYYREYTEYSPSRESLKSIRFEPGEYPREIVNSQSVSSAIWQFVCSN